jgi:tRNA uridine 5-carboxymethylaminomethyl modification enzyme
MKKSYKIINQGHRAQIDRKLYKQNMQSLILNTENLTVLAESVNDLIIQPENDSSQSNPKLKIAGVLLGMNENKI